MAANPPRIWRRASFGQHAEAVSEPGRFTDPRFRVQGLQPGGHHALVVHVRRLLVLGVQGVQGTTAGHQPRHAQDALPAGPGLCGPRVQSLLHAGLGVLVQPILAGRLFQLQRPRPALVDGAFQAGQSLRRPRPHPDFRLGPGLFQIILGKCLAIGAVGLGQEGRDPDRVPLQQRDQGRRQHLSLRRLDQVADPLGRDHRCVVVVRHRVHGGRRPHGNHRSLGRIQAGTRRPIVGDAGHLVAQMTGPDLDLPVPGAGSNRFRQSFQEIHHGFPLIGVGETIKRVPDMLVEANVDGLDNPAAVLRRLVRAFS